jgi:hypothetical protein
MSTRSDLQRSRHERDREREADKIEADIGHLDRSRKKMVATARRLRASLDVDQLVVLAGRGEELTQAETAVLAAERPDVFNEVFEKGLAR